MALKYLNLVICIILTVSEILGENSETKSCQKNKIGEDGNCEYRPNMYKESEKNSEEFELKNESVFDSDIKMDILNDPTNLKNSKKKKKHYSKEHMTNELDNILHSKLDEIERTIISYPKRAHNQFKRLYKEYKSPRALFGMGLALNKLALQILEKSENLAQLSKEELRDVKNARDKTGVPKPTMVAVLNEPHVMSRSERTFHRSNERREEAMKHQKKSGINFCQVLTLEDVPTSLFLLAGSNCLKLVRHWNMKEQELSALEKMWSRFPKILKYPSDLAILKMMMGNFKEAERVLRIISLQWPLAKLEKCILGLNLKLLSEQDSALNINEKSDKLMVYCESVHNLEKTFHRIGNFLAKTSKNKEANIVFGEGVKQGILMSQWQRSEFGLRFNMKGLTSKPFWKISELGNAGAQLKLFSQSWKLVKDEGLNALAENRDLFQPQANCRYGEGCWEELVLIKPGTGQVQSGCDVMPKTCKLINDYLQETTECSRCHIKLGLLKPGVGIPPKSGQTNTIVKAYLGLVLSEVSTQNRIYFRVGDQTLNNPFAEGEWLVTDPSFESEIKNLGSKTFLLLIVDLWHPELNPETTRRLNPLPTESNESNESNSILYTGKIESKIQDSVILTNQNTNGPTLI